MDPKVRNLLKFVVKNMIGPVVIFIVALRFFGISDYFRLFGQITLVILLWKAGYAFYQRVLLPAKKPKDFGKWAIVTGTHVCSVFILLL